MAAVKKAADASGRKICFIGMSLNHYLEVRGGTLKHALGQLVQGLLGGRPAVVRRGCWAAALQSCLCPAAAPVQRLAPPVLRACT